MNEAETRAELIDPKLKTAGWGVSKVPKSSGNGMSWSICKKSGNQTVSCVIILYVGENKGM